MREPVVTREDMNDNGITTEIINRRCLICCWADWCAVGVPVFYKRREVPAREPDRVSHRQHPQDRQLVQHLADKTECHVEVKREKTCNEKAEC